MNITQEQMNDINNVQLKMFKEFACVCNKLNLKYYAVHGTLLGAYRCNGFFPFDDDIDVAMPRKDYDIFIEKGQQMLKDNYFIQCNKTEADYPLVFTKLRDSETTFIQPVLKKLNVNKGIYIDIFPIDFYSNSLTLKIKEKLLSARISNRLNANKRSLLKKIISLLSCIIYPNWYSAMKKKDNLYVNMKKSENCIVYGGKIYEKNIPFDLFGNGTILDFEDIQISVPSNYKEYLNIIYGDCESYSPSAKYMVSDNLVEISADIVDTKKSYREYIK